MGTNPLWGHLLRIARADDHRMQLHNAILTHNEEEPYETTYASTGGREIVVSVDFSNQIPHQKALMVWGILTGDVVHQLRASLDNMVHLLTERTGAAVPDRQGNPLHDVSFPIIEKSRRWSRAVERCLWGVPDEALPIFRALQPFAVSPAEPEATPIAVLNRLWNEDKHRAIPLLDVRVELLGLDELPDLGIEVKSALVTSLDFTQGEVEVATVAYREGLDLRTDVHQLLDNHLRFRWEVGLDPSIPKVAPGGLLMASLDTLQRTTMAALLSFNAFFPAE